MKALTAEDVLQLWERGERLAPAQRLLLLLSWARPGAAAAELAKMTIGESELALLELRQVTFGGQLVAVESCPSCRTPTEVSIDPEPLMALRPPGADGDTPAGRVTLEADGWSLAFQSPTVADLAAVSGEIDGASARARLLELCALEVRTPSGDAVAASQIPFALQGRLASALDRADPAAELTLPLDCAVCHEVWQARLDVSAFLWREIAVTARRLLREVHELASRYGWSEREILALSAGRRHAYLEGRWA